MAAHPYILAAGNKLFPAAFLSSFGFRPCRRRHAAAWWFCGQPSACGLMAAFPLAPIVTIMSQAASSPLVWGVGLCMVASCSPPPIPRYGARHPRPIAWHIGAAFAPGLAGKGAAMRQAICRQQSESTISAVISIKGASPADMMADWAQ